MVLDAGRLVSMVASVGCSHEAERMDLQVEIGTPRELLNNKAGYLYSLVDASGDREHLLEMANG